MLVTTSTRTIILQSTSTQHYMLQGTPYDKYISQGYLYKIDIAYIANVYNIYHIFTSNNHTRKYGQKLSNVHKILYCNPRCDIYV